MRHRITSFRFVEAEAENESSRIAHQALFSTFLALVFPLRAAAADRRGLEVSS
jgi:hypothetical protein